MYLLKEMNHLNKKILGNNQIKNRDNLFFHKNNNLIYDNLQLIQNLDKQHFLIIFLKIACKKNKKQNKLIYMIN